MPKDFLNVYVIPRESRRRASTMCYHSQQCLYRSSIVSNMSTAEMDTTPDETAPVEETWADIPEDIMSLSTEEIVSRIRLIDNDIKVSMDKVKVNYADML